MILSKYLKPLSAIFSRGRLATSIPAQLIEGGNYNHMSEETGRKIKMTRNKEFSRYIQLEITNRALMEEICDDLLESGQDSISEFIACLLQEHYFPTHDPEEDKEGK
jgi:hypothetical protein